MPDFFLWLAQSFWTFGSSILGRIMMTFGLAFSVESAVDAWVAPAVADFFAGIPMPMLGYLGMMRVDDAMTLVISAAIVRYGGREGDRVFLKRAG